MTWCPDKRAVNTAAGHAAAAGKAQHPAESLGVVQVMADVVPVEPARRVADSAAWSMCTGVQQPAGDRFLAAQDGADRRAADQVGQAADHAVGALMDVPGLGGQRARLMMVQVIRRLRVRSGGVPGWAGHGHRGTPRPL